jgi:hypothetical protein
MFVDGELAGDTHQSKGMWPMSLLYFGPARHWALIQRPGREGVLVMGKYCLILSGLRAVLETKSLGAALVIGYGRRDHQFAEEAKRR